MTAPSIRRRILQDFCAALAAVAPVFRNPSAPVPAGAPRWLVVNDEGHENTGEFAESEGVKALTLTVEGYARGAAGDDEAEALADALYCEAVAAVCLDRSRGGLAIDTRETSCVFGSTEGENAELVALCTVGVAIEFAAAPADPRRAP